MSRIQPPPRCKVCRHVYVPLPMDKGFCEICDPTEPVKTDATGFWVPKDYAEDDERINWLDNQ